MRGKQLEDAEKKSLPCRENPRAWTDVKHPVKIANAIKICLTQCRHLDWCEEQRRDAARLYHVTPGVWAGKYYGHRMLPVDD